MRWGGGWRWGRGACPSGWARTSRGTASSTGGWRRRSCRYPPSKAWSWAWDSRRRGARAQKCTTRSCRVRPGDEPRRRHRGRNDDGGGAGAAGGDEADLDPDDPAQDGGSRHRGRRAGPVGALRCDGCAGDGGHCRGDGGAGAGAGDGGEVRRRRAERTEAQRGGLPRAGARAVAQEGRGRLMKRHVVLIGLPGSGKTTVGRLVSEQLHCGFVDIDAMIARKEGRPISMIFAEKGEATFRALERQEMESQLNNPPAVIAPGGGWAAQEGAIEGAGDRAFAIYLPTKTRPA